MFFANLQTVGKELVKNSHQEAIRFLHFVPCKETMKKITFRGKEITKF